MTETERRESYYDGEGGEVRAGRSGANPRSDPASFLGRFAISDWRSGRGRLRELRTGLFVLEELVGGDHGDAVPGADLVAEGAADAAG